MDPPKHADNKATQVKHPWRATARSMIIAGVALLPLLPSIAETAGIHDIPIVARALVVTAAASRVLAMQSVETWLDRYIPWLAAQPYEGAHRDNRARNNRINDVDGG